MLGPTMWVSKSWKMSSRKRGNPRTRRQRMWERVSRIHISLFLRPVIFCKLSISFLFCPTEGDLYEILQSADLLSYYDAFISNGGDNIQQLLEADEEDFEEIIELVGMASKRLHVRRLQKALDKWQEGTLKQGEGKPLYQTTWMILGHFCRLITEPSFR